LIAPAPAVISVGLVMTGAHVAPPYVRVMLFAFVLDVPVFWKVTPPKMVAWAIVGRTADTCAELVNDPNRPKTNPAMAMAAMRVMAMRMTVASTGEMAFLFFL